MQRARQICQLTMLCIALLLSACASRPAKPLIDYNSGYDFSQVNTVAFYHESGQVAGTNPLQVSDMARARVDLALENAMRAKGLTMVKDPEQADLLLSWHLATQEKTDVRTYETAQHSGFYGAGFYPYNRYSMYSCWNCLPTRTEIDVREYTVGTFIIDLIDPQLKKSVWRSVTSSRMKGDFKQDQDKYDAAAARVLAAFPPG
jgi:hypothetical protein